MGNALGISQFLPTDSPEFGQIIIATTGVPQRFPSNAIRNVGTIKSLSSNNAAGVTLGGPTVAISGGIPLMPGDPPKPFYPPKFRNMDQIFIVGTAGDIISFGVT